MTPTIKKIVLILLLGTFCLIVLWSCSKEEDPVVDYTQLGIGSMETNKTYLVAGIDTITFGVPFPAQGGQITVQAGEAQLFGISIAAYSSDTEPTTIVVNSTWKYIRFCSSQYEKVKIITII